MILEDPNSRVSASLELEMLEKPSMYQLWYSSACSPILSVGCDEKPNVGESNCASHCSKRRSKY